VEERVDEILTEKRALFADVIDAVTTSALGCLDLDSLYYYVQRRRASGHKAGPARGGCYGWSFFVR
jgi:hypothetical protein